MANNLKITNDIIANIVHLEISEAIEKSV